MLRIINEPTAAAIAYGLDKKTEKILGIATRSFVRRSRVCVPAIACWASRFGEEVQGSTLLWHGQRLSNIRVVFIQIPGNYLMRPAHHVNQLASPGQSGTSPVAFQSLDSGLAGERSPTTSYGSETQDDSLGSPLRVFELRSVRSPWVLDEEHVQIAFGG